MTWNWTSTRDAPTRLATTGVQLSAEWYSTGWNAALQRKLRVPMLELPTSTAEPPVVSLRVRPPQLRVMSCHFAPSPPPTSLDAAASRAGAAASAGDPLAAPRASATASRTRIRPPADVVKLQDRLFYLLQPSLEQIVDGSQLGFPHEPFPYQLDGVAFLYPRHACVLADEMGLGKTMQAITAVRLLIHAGELRQALLVCPKPLVTNWQREFQLWAPEIPVCVIEGDQARRRFQWTQQAFPVKIANYEAVVRDRWLVEQQEVDFDLVILDEAQRIKNRAGATHQVVRSIPRTRSWALTGTPVENSHEDLVGIFEFLTPGYLTAEMSASQMGAAAAGHVLRRTKDMVLQDLPPKLYRDARIELLPEQWETYQSAEDDGVIQLRELEDSLTIQHVFELVLRLKQICNFDPRTGASSKLERLEADLEEVAASGQKAIVFSQWVHTLEQIAERLEPRFSTLQFHGRVPNRRRDAVIEEFRDNAKRRVLLMSYGAGSVGLNLQFCRYVFLFDRWWNPAVEDQAINRAHRIGASGPVTVTRLLAHGTIEERIDEVLTEKRRLFDAILSAADPPAASGLTRQEIFGLFPQLAKRQTRA